LKTCHACGAHVTEDWRYCNKCGAKRKGGSTKKIGIGVVVPVVIFVVLVGLDIYAASSLQFRSDETGDFDWADLSLDVAMSVCNPTFMPTSFDEISADLNYKSTRIGRLCLIFGISFAIANEANIMTSGDRNVANLALNHHWLISPIPMYNEIKVNAAGRHKNP